MIVALACIGFTALGFFAGWVGRGVHRRLRVLTRPCPYCNGNGYFASAEALDRSLNDTHSQSASYRP